MTFWQIEPGISDSEY